MRVSYRVVALGGAAALLGSVLVTVAGAAPGKALGPGCQADRSTTVLAGGTAARTAGGWVPCLVDTGMSTGETGLAIDRQGRLFRSAADDPVGIALSTDQGRTWKRQVLPEGVGTAIADSFVDPDTGRLFYAEAGETPVWRSDDQGKTWRASTFSEGTRYDWNKMWTGRPVTPRRTGYPNNVYYCNWTAIPLGVVGIIRCYRSTDGGVHFQQVGEDITPDVCIGPYLPNPTHGRGVVDRRDGTMYLVVDSCSKPTLFVSKDEGQTWDRRPITGASSATALSPVDAAQNTAWLMQNASGKLNPVGPELAAGQHTDSIALDANGRLYTVWVDGSTYLPKMAWSRDGGTSWSAPIGVTPLGVQQAILPSLTTAPSGRLGLAYYGTTDRKAWTGYLSVIDGITTRRPTIDVATVTRPGDPLMPDPCCWQSGAQEYTAARWAPDGTLYAAFAKYVEGDQRGVVGRLVPRKKG